MEHYTSGDPVIADTTEADAASADDDEVVAQIKELLDTRVSSGGGAGRRRYRLPGFPGRCGLPAHAGLVLGLPEFDGHAQDGHREPSEALRAGSVEVQAAQ